MYLVRRYGGFVMDWPRCLRGAWRSSRGMRGCLWNAGEAWQGMCVLALALLYQRFPQEWEGVLKHPHTHTHTHTERHTHTHIHTRMHTLSHTYTVCVIRTFT